MNEVLNYFGYLRDASKKIGSYGDFYRCLLGYYSNGFKNIVTEVSEDVLHRGKINRSDDLGEVFALYLKQMRQNKSRQIFVGFGHVVGGLRKKVFGSLLYAPIVLNTDGFSRGELGFEIDFKSMVINYDLLSSILPDYFATEDDDTAKDILDLISVLESSLNNKHDFVNLPLLVEGFLSDLMNINENILLSKNMDFTYDFIMDNKNRESPLYKKEFFYNSEKSYFFISEIPSSISTWKSLDLFCDGLIESNFKNDVLNEMFSNVFSLEVEQKKVEKNKFDDILNVLPIVLSSTQKKAITNAFSSRISYVQGPPGTGKSHTIAALILFSYLAGKKILVVSQKDTALTVVANKIAGFFDKKLSVPLIYFNKNEKVLLKNNLLDICAGNVPEDEELDLLGLEISKLEKEVVFEGGRFLEKKRVFSKVFKERVEFYLDNEEFIKAKNVYANMPSYGSHLSSLFLPTRSDNLKALELLGFLEKKYKEMGVLSRMDMLRLAKMKKKFNDFFEVSDTTLFDVLFKRGLLFQFVNDLLRLSYSYGQLLDAERKLETQDFVTRLMYDLRVSEEKLLNKKEMLFNLYHKRSLYQNVKTEDINIELQKFGKLLHWKNGEKISEKMADIDYGKVLEAYPAWLSEIRNIGEILPTVSGLFDLVVVDEASQVNLAEILPVFYRGKNVCVIGDHKQLGLNSVGLSFSLGKKFDKIIWNKYRPGGLSFDEAQARNLTVSRASILDLLRSDENQKMFNFVMLDEHYRSLPGLASFNNKMFYDDKIKIMTEVPEKSLVNCFSAIQVSGKKVDKVNEEEAVTVFNLVKFLLNKKLDEKSLALFKKEILLNDFVPEKPTIGIVSSVRNQVECIRDLLGELSDEDFEVHRLFCGTPEELQGDEFDIVIMTTTTDENSRNNGHFNNENRFNVATSRARSYVVLVYTEINKIPLYESYLNYFSQGEHKNNALGWSCDLSSELQKVMFREINLIVSNLGLSNVKIFSNVRVLGQKSFFFVLYDEKTHKSVALNVGGLVEEVINSDFDLEKISMLDFSLEKMGWSIITTGIEAWYSRGELDVLSDKCLNEKNRLSEEIKKGFGK